MVNNTYLHSDDGVDEEEHQDEETDVRQGLGTHSRKIAIRTECIGSRDSSVVRAPDVWLLLVRVPTRTVGEFSSPGSTFWAGFLFWYVSPPCCRTHGFKWTDTVNWCMVVWCIQHVRWNSSSLTWHQPCDNQTALYVHHFSRYKKICAIKASKLRANKGYTVTPSEPCATRAQWVRLRADNSAIWKHQ